MTAIASPARAGAWEQRRIEVSLRIERAGLELMRERGVENVTVEQISRAADISVRTFFRYFRNVRDVLTGVPRRESRRMCAALLARPAGESLLDGFHAWFEVGHDRDLSSPTAELEAETFALWRAIVRDAPDLIQAESRAATVLGAELEPVVRARFGFGPGDDEKVGVLATAFAAVIWYVFTRTVTDDDTEGLWTRLDQAFDLLGHLHSAETV